MRLALAIALSSLPMAAHAAPTCDEAGIQELVEALEASPPVYTSVFLGPGLDKVCTGTSITRAMGAPAEMRQTLIAQAIVADPSAWLAGCPGGIDVLRGTGTEPPSEHPKMIAEGCQLDRFGMDASTVRGWGDDRVLRILAIGLVQGVKPELRQKILAAVKRPATG